LPDWAKKRQLGYFLAAIGAQKFGSGALFATLWATFGITGLRWATYEKQKLGYILSVFVDMTTKQSGNPVSN